MDTIVKELVVKGKVQDGKTEKGGGQKGGGLSSADKEGLIRECLERVKDLLEYENGR